MPPRVTVIIATYNWASVLPYSIGSVLDQSFRDFELLVIGDGCTDESERVVAEIPDSRVRWIGLPTNTGHQSGPNNEGLRQADGEIVAYLGHDDLWLPHHLASLVGAIDEGADVASTIVAFIGGQGERSVPKFLSPLAPNGWMPPTGFGHRKRVTDRIGGWRHYRELTIDPEHELLLRAREAGFRFGYVPRLTAIKLAASMRRDVYKLRPCDEQADWLRRIRSEPDFEANLLGQWVLESPRQYRIGLRRLWPSLLRETVKRVAQRAGDMVKPSRARARIEARRRFKGL